MVFFIGNLFGYIGVLFTTDNYGRKFSMIISWSLTLFGAFLLALSFNIWTACVGLFLQAWALRPA
jgi:hypothetical protein